MAEITNGRSVGRARVEFCYSRDFHSNSNKKYNFAIIAFFFRKSGAKTRFFKGSWTFAIFLQYVNFYEHASRAMSDKKLQKYISS